MYLLYIYIDQLIAIYTYKINKWFKMLETWNINSWENYFIKLQRSLYKLKQYGDTCYNHFNEYY